MKTEELNMLIKKYEKELSSLIGRNKELGEYLKEPYDNFWKANARVFLTKAKLEVLQELKSQIQEKT